MHQLSLFLLCKYEIDNSTDNTVTISYPSFMNKNKGNDAAHDDMCSVKLPSREWYGFLIHNSLDISASNKDKVKNI